MCNIISHLKKYPTPIRINNDHKVYVAIATLDLHTVVLSGRLLTNAPIMKLLSAATSCLLVNVGLASKFLGNNDASQI